MSGNVCKFCGTREHSKINNVYLWGSSAFASEWKQSDNCQQRCEQIRVQLEGTVEVLCWRIEAAKQQLESLHGKHVGQAEIYAVIATLEGKE